MKFTSIIYATLMAAVTVQAAAPAQTTDVNVLSADEVCNLPGHPCNKMKRAAEAVAEAMAEPEAVAGRASLINLLVCTMLTWSTLDPKRRYRFRFCYRRGEACSKAKRDALALAEAVAEAHASANPEPEPEAEAGKHCLYRFLEV